jgi:hypothetical protein
MPALGGARNESTTLGLAIGSMIRLDIPYGAETVAVAPASAVPFAGKMCKQKNSRNRCGYGSVNNRFFELHWWASLESNQAPTDYEKNGDLQLFAFACVSKASLPVCRKVCKQTLPRI